MYPTDIHMGGCVHIDDLSHEALELLSKLSDPIKPEDFPYPRGGVVPKTVKHVIVIHLAFISSKSTLVFDEASVLSPLSASRPLSILSFDTFLASQ